MNHKSKIKVLLASTSRCTRQESVDTNTLKTTKNGEEKIMQLIAITCRSPRIRKRNQFRQFISAINQAFHKSSKSGPTTLDTYYYSISPITKLQSRILAQKRKQYSMHGQMIELKLSCFRSSFSNIDNLKTPGK